MRKLVAIAAFLFIVRPLLAGEEYSIVDDARVLSTAIRYWGKSLGPDTQLTVTKEYMGVESLDIASLPDQLAAAGVSSDRAEALVKTFFARNENAKGAAPPSRNGNRQALSFRLTLPGYDGDRTHALVFGTPDDGFVYQAVLEKVSEEEWRVISSSMRDTMDTGTTPHAAVADGLSPYRVGGDVKVPKVVRRVEPVYPGEARAARISGVVILEVIIDKTGTIRSVEVLKPLPMDLDRAAVEAVKQWKFEPGTLNGEPVDVFFNLSINFKLDGKPKD